MADTRTITIKIRNESKAQETKPVVINEEENVEINFSYIMHPIKTVEKSLVGKNVFMNQAYEVAKSAISQSINLSVNRYFSMKEDYIGQNDYQNAITGIHKAATLGTAIVSGAMVGGKAGPIGMAVGATVGAIGFGATEFINYQGRMSNYYQSLNASNYQTGFMRTRAGLTDGSKGTEN